MSLLDDIAADGSAAWFSTGDLARSATYTPAAGGPATTCTVLVQYGAQPVVDRSPIASGRNVRYLYDEATIIVAAGEVDLPKFGDTFDVDSRTWQVQEVLAGNGVHWRLRAQTGAKASHS